MAKQLEEVVVDGMAEVTHGGAEINVTMPAWWVTLGKIAIMTPEKFQIEIARVCCKDLQATFQSGVAKQLIDIRAVARPGDYTKAEGLDGKRPLMDKDTKGRLPQDRVDAFKLTLRREPKAVAECPSVKASATAQAMLEQGLDETMVVTVIAAGHGQVIAEKALALALSNMEK